LFEAAAIGFTFLDEKSRQIATDLHGRFSELPNFEVHHFFDKPYPGIRSHARRQSKWQAKEMTKTE
jgi:hypothetical protein